MASEQEIIAALRLINTYKVGASRFYQLVDEYGTSANAVSALEKNAKYKPWPVEKAEEELNKAKSLGVFILLYSDNEYPDILRYSDNAPPILYVKGNLEALHFEKSMAVVGGRAASVNGRKTAAKIAKELTESGVCVVSGMAKGIDTSAHKGAMYANNETGSTIAVLGTGVDIIYPPENKDVYEQIIKQGCVLSEFPLGTMPLASQFPQRNKIVAAMSNGVLVVEAGVNSGSLITAKFGAEMKKTLFAVPGTPGESRAQGSNMLIKKGAILVEDASDILPFLKGNKNVVPPQLNLIKQKNLVFENNDVNYSENIIEDDTSKSLVSLITVDGVDIDELIRLTGKDASTLALDILELELNGVAERRPGNKVALTIQN